MGGSEIILILLAVLVLFGADKLPEFAKGLGKGLREVKKATDEIKNELTNSSSEIMNEVRNVSQTLQNSNTDIISESTNIQKEIDSVVNTEIPSVYLDAQKENNAPIPYYEQVKQNTEESKP
jgi:sec-independent protein translocase protein TatA